MRRPLIALLAATAMVAGVPSAPADEHNRPPDARLIVGERGQTGLLGSYCWSWRTGEGGVTQCVDTVWDFPNRPLRAQPSREARIRIKHSARIESASLHGWRRVRDTGYGEEPVGEGRRFGVRVDPNRNRGEITGWTLRFRLPRREGHLYLDLFVRWRNGGDASYTFHVRLMK